MLEPGDAPRSDTATRQRPGVPRQTLEAGWASHGGRRTLPRRFVWAGWVEAASVLCPERGEACRQSTARGCTVGVGAGSLGVCVPRSLEAAGASARRPSRACRLRPTGASAASNLIPVLVRGTPPRALEPSRPRDLETSRPQDLKTSPDSPRTPPAPRPGRTWRWHGCRPGSPACRSPMRSGAMENPVLNISGKTTRSHWSSEALCNNVLAFM